MYLAANLSSHVRVLTSNFTANNATDTSGLGARSGHLSLACLEAMRQVYVVVDRTKIQCLVPVADVVRDVDSQARP